MAHSRPLPLATAMALTLAAGLSIAQEHTRSHAAAAAEAALALTAADGVGPRVGLKAVGGKCAETRVVPQEVTGHAVATPSPAVGSRALIGADEEEAATDARPCHPAAGPD